MIGALNEAGQLTEKIKTRAVRTDNLRSIPRMWWEESIKSWRLPSDVHLWAIA